MFFVLLNRCFFKVYLCCGGNIGYSDFIIIISIGEDDIGGEDEEEEIGGIFGTIGILEIDADADAEVENLLSSISKGG